MEICYDKGCNNIGVAIKTNIQIKLINNDVEETHPQTGSSSTRFLVKLEFGSVGFWEEEKTGVPGEKPLGAKEGTNNKLNPHICIDARIWTRATLVGAPRTKRRHYQLVT